jgi:hypothetical protein
LQVFSAILKTARGITSFFDMPAVRLLAIFDLVGEADGANASDADREPEFA